MNIYKTESFKEAVEGNTYPGRGIITGKSANGRYAVIAYFIMGRSENSRNRVFIEQGTDLMIKPFDESKVEDPSLIIYYPVRISGNHIIVTNGDQTDTVYEFIENGDTFENALMTREFEPDSPNFTPRISAVIDFNKEKDDFSYRQSILKSGDAEGTCCSRYFYNYKAQNGLGHFIHTYVCDGNPIPSFMGEPQRIEIPNTADDFAKEIWDSLDRDNKVSLYVNYIEVESGKSHIRIINKNN